MGDLAPLDTNDAGRGGLRTFALVWLALVVSSMGSQLAGFALGVWLYDTTRSATLFGLVTLANVVPAMLVTPFAGALIDRRDRSRVLLAAQVGAGACSLALWILVAHGALRVGTLLPVLGLAAVFGAVQMPCLMAMTTVLVPRAQLGRANGINQFGFAVGAIAMPSAAGALLPILGLRGILVLDVVSFVFAVGVLVFVRVPPPAASAEARTAPKGIRGDASFGFRYIAERPGLLALLSLFAGVNFNIALVSVLLTPLVLGFGTAASLGIVTSAAGLGMLAGSVITVVWGTPRRRVLVVMVSIFAQGALLVLAIAKASVLLVSAAAFGVVGSTQLVNACSQTIWQRVVPRDVQGRVFAARAVVARAATPIACAIAGPLADRIFEPLLATNGPLAATLGRVIGVGQGRGIALLFALLGVLTCAGAVLAWANPRVRRLEENGDEPRRPDAVGAVRPQFE